LTVECDAKCVNYPSRRGYALGTPRLDLASSNGPLPALEMASPLEFVRRLLGIENLLAPSNIVIIEAT